MPNVISNWDKLSAETKTNMTAINDFYCGRHLVLNLQDYAGAALKEWEQVESDSGKLGREKHLPWSTNRKYRQLNNKDKRKSTSEKKHKKKKNRS